MKPGSAGGAHLCYCTNIHPAESWPEVRSNLERHVLDVKARVSPNDPFAVGLRLSELAARELAAPDAIEECRDFLERNGLYVFTINAFPYGRFHGSRVKEAVYLPDWLSDERLHYSNLAARILSILMPDDDPSYGSVSTVPGAFKTSVTGSEQLEAISRRMIAHAAELVGIERRSGRCLSLAIEPEPCCILETVSETIEFFNTHLYSHRAVAYLSELTGLGEAQAEEALHRHLGICLDACHAAVEFEALPQAVDDLRNAGIRIAKVQLSTGLRLYGDSAEGLAELRRFDEEVYLHQVIERHGSKVVRFNDIPDALAAAGMMESPTGTRPATREWRVHFHVPLFLEKLASFHNTQPFLRELLRAHREDPLTEHLEVETYTWDVLPTEFRGEPVERAIARELEWVIGELSA